jgi:hypothetical protein
VLSAGLLVLTAHAAALSGVRVACGMRWD